MFEISFFDFMTRNLFNDYEIEFMPGITSDTFLTSDVRCNINTDTRIAYVYVV